MQDTPTVTPTVSFAVLYALFATLPDPRRGQGRRFPLAALLTLAVAAILANHRSVLAIAEWGAAQGDEYRQALGFGGGTMPHQTTLHRLFARLDAHLLAATLMRAVAGITDPIPGYPFERGKQGVAIDGKAHRGRLAGQPRTTCPMHMLSAVCHETGLVLAQMPVTAMGDKAAAELATAPALIAHLDWHGRVFTGDALYCQRELCQQVMEAGGDYLVLVKGNQQALRADIATLFAHRADCALNAASLPAQDMRAAVTHEVRHGREEHRTLIASTELNNSLDWPGVAQVFMLERRWQERGKEHQSVCYGITSLPPAVADAARLLTLKREHWQIENGLHYVKDVTLGEDASRVRVGQGPNVMALLRDTALNLLHSTGCTRIAAQLRLYCRHPAALLALLGLPLPQHA